MTDEEYGAFYRASFALLVRQLYAMTGDFGEAQDAVQEAFVRGWDRRSKLSRDEGGPEAWIRTVAWRLAVSRWRRARRGRELEQERMRFAPQVAAAPGLEHTELVAALRRLPAAQRQAVVLHHLCDLSLQQIAAETGAALGTVKARLSRGRAALAGYLREQPEELTVVEGGRRTEANHCA
ncbi:SigE family RNA polymerase sigma factor [Kitasatospora sp. NPDC051853]|uniref:SigE family RNA polymerase sigma factor n=1 Tax=Kitasatospora sp. NPDC051853 TaxID=3364058 RepID=UPI00379BEDE0